MPAEPGTRDAARSPLLEALRADPARAAILTDVDGTLAPIAERPGEATVPAEAQRVLVALAGRFGLVGCVSGRRALEARRMVRVKGIAYAGNHGLELLPPGEEEPILDPALDRPEAATSFVEGLDRETLEDGGIRVEDKGPIQALHWRGADDEASAEAQARAIAGAAEKAGLHPHWGRKVLELRPLVEVGKDAAVRALLSRARTRATSHSPPDSGGKYDTAIYAGDDSTDLDAFRGLRQLRDQGELESAICVGIVSPEAPPGLAEQSDLTVDGPAGWLAILESLAR